MIYLGIDGGGTKTRLALQRNDEEPKYLEYPISLKVRNGDFRSAAKRFEIIVREAIGRSRDSFAIGIGLSGMSREEDQVALRKDILAIPKFARAKIHIESDATLTLKTVLAEGDEGILIIAGTGSVVFYQPSGGPARRIGGWGPLLSDEGSGYHIGLRVLRHYVNILDGVFPRDAFSRAIEARLAQYGVEQTTPRELTERAATDVAFVASLAQDAMEAADKIAAVFELVHEELVDLITLVLPLILFPIMSGNKPYRLYLAGHIAQQPITIQAFETAFGDERTGTMPVELHLVDEHAPAYKALELARGL